MAWSLRKAMGWDTPPPPIMRHEVVPGTPKPSIILMDMVIQRITANLELVSLTSGYSRSWEYLWEKDDLKVSWDLRDVNPGSSTTWGVRDFRVHFKGRSFNFTDDERDRFLKTAKFIKKWKEDHEKNKAESERQQKAVNLIEDFFKPKPPPPPEPAPVEMITVEKKPRSRAKRELQSEISDWVDPI